MDENITSPAPEEPKQTNKERLKEITDSIEAGIKDLFQSERFKEYLRVMAKFHKYSVNNTMLIHMQRPDATRVAGKKRWLQMFNRTIKESEIRNGIPIIAPAPYIRKVEKAKLDPETNAPLVDHNGEVIMEEKEIKIPMYKAVKVFDVAQTMGEPLPQLASDLKDDVKQYEIFMEALRRSSPVPIDFKPLADNLDGYFSLKDQRISIREGMSEVQTVCAAVHEISHSLLHNKDAMTEGEKSQRTQEVEAESIAYAVCAYFDIETGDNSLGYIASWSSDKELKELKASLETINNTASTLISDIDKNFDLICKERGIDRTPQTIEPRAHEALFLLDDSVYLHVQRRSDDHDYDFTLYSADSLKLMDGGVTELPEDSTLIDAPLITVADEILADYGTSYEKMEPVDLNKLHDIEEANVAVQPAEIMSEPLRPLDTYPLPDKTTSPAMLEAVGYTEGDLLPISKDKAHELLENGFSVYSVFDPGGTFMCMDGDDIDARSSDEVFAVLQEEWEDSPEFRNVLEDRLAHQEEREAAFMEHPDSFAIYQMEETKEVAPLRFLGYDEIQQRGVTPERDIYNLIYTAELADKSLDDIFYEFNMERPGDFGGYSLSTSDIVALNHDGDISYHYVDRVGFKELPDFGADNPLKNAEMSVEDDYNMVDGIINNGDKQPTVAELEQQAKSGQPISLMDLADATHRENGTRVEARDEVKPKRMSIYEQLRQPLPQQPARDKSPKKRGEPEL